MCKLDRITAAAKPPVRLCARSRLMLLALALCLLPLNVIAEQTQLSPWAASIREASQQWEQEKGKWRFWSYADKAAFCERYGAYPYQEIPNETGAPAHYALPTAEDTPYEAALDTAKRAVVEHLGAKADVLDVLPICAYFRQSFWTNQDGDKSDAWIIQFCETSGEQNPLFDAVVFSPSGQVLTVMERDVPREINGTAALRQWSSQNLMSADSLPDTLYFNPDGGKYYHYDANCRSVSRKYLPLTPFANELLTMRPEFSVLTGCPICVK